MVTKLSLDSKQEVSIDPRIVGIEGKDEMSISSIASVESFLTSFPWATTKTTDDLLWNIRIHPGVAPLYVGPAQQTWLLPACAYAQLPFGYWRGTMRYRFQIVCSEYHRGRLRFTYDPGAIINAETNVAYTRIVDLCNETDFTIDVSWGQSQTYLETRGLNTFLNTTYGTTLLASQFNDSNGVLGVYVVNDLTTPNSTTNNDISINVSVSMCEDCEFAMPHSRIETYTFTPQGDDSDSPNDNDNAPVVSECDDCIMTCDVIDHTNDVYFGEVITSFRTMMRRYHLHAALLLGTGTANTIYGVIRPDFPTQRGINGNGIHVNATALPCYQTKLTMMNYLAAAYLAYRGGMRWKYIHQSSSASDNTPIVWRRRPVLSTVEQSEFTNTLTLTNASTTARTITTNRNGSADGCEVVTTIQQPVTEIEMPYYSADRFSTSKNIGSSSNVIANTYTPYKRSHQLTVTTFNPSVRILEAYCAASEDSNFFLFQGCPPIGIYTPT